MSGIPNRMHLNVNHKDISKHKYQCTHTHSVCILTEGSCFFLSWLNKKAKLSFKQNKVYLFRLAHAKLNRIFCFPF